MWAPPDPKNSCFTRRHGGGSDRGRNGGFGAAGAEFQLWGGRQTGGGSDLLGWFVGPQGVEVRVYLCKSLEKTTLSAFFVHSTQ